MVQLSQRWRPRRSLVGILLLVGAVLAGCHAPPATRLSSVFPQVSPDARSTTGVEDTEFGLYPPPRPTAEGTLLHLSAGCPDLTDVAQADGLSLDTVLELLASLHSGQLEDARRVTDPALWPLLSDGIGGESQTVQAEDVTVPRPARESPYSDLLANSCGEVVRDRSWWVQVCPGACSAPKVAQAASLTAHIYLLSRHDQWLIWAME